jgi:hypothetical protein
MRRLYKISIILIAALLITTPALAITNGEPDDGEHPYVGVMLYPVGDGYYTLCSGTLISPTVFLTAAHCVYEPWKEDITIYVSFAEKWKGFTETVTGKGYPHPEYEENFPLPDTYDLGVVVLDAPVTDKGYGVVAEVGYLDTFTRAIGSKDPFFTSVGYGDQNALPGKGNYLPWDFARYKGEHRLTNLKSALIRGYNIQLTNNPGKGSGSGGTCFGDSGGPIFYNDTNIIVAVNSFGLAPHCVGADYAFRTDIQAAHDFLADFLP